VKIGFVGGAYDGRSRIIDSARCINWYPEKESPESKEVAALVPTPGVTTFATLSGISRGERKVGNTLFVVSGGNLFSLNAAGVSTNLGTLNTTTGNVSITDNGTQLMIVDGANGYIWNISTSTFSQITDADFPNGATVCDFMDTYFIVNVPNTGAYQISAQNNGLAWDALDVKSAEGAPDNLVTLIVDHQLLWLFGTDTVELHYDSGNADFPFTRMQGAFMEVGCAAAYSPAKLDSSVFWLGQSPRGEKIVFKAQGYVAKRISTHQIEVEIDSYSTISDAVGMSYVEEGHSFYVLTFPTADRTWVYDSSTNLWHERRSYNGKVWGRWIAGSIVAWQNSHYVTDYKNANVYQLDHSAFTDNGTQIRRLRSARHINKERERISFTSFELDMERGLGTATGQGVDPQMMLRISKDGGYSWSGESWVSAGKIGDYTARAKWFRLGLGDDWVFEVSMTDPVPAHIVEAYLT